MLKKTFLNLKQTRLAFSFRTIGIVRLSGNRTGPSCPKFGLVQISDTHYIGLCCIFSVPDSQTLLSYCHADRFLTAPFEPEKICMDPETGRVYHPAVKLPNGVGLISDKLSILWTEERRFVFEDGDSNPPSHFIWNKTKLKLTNELIPVLKEVRAQMPK